MVSLEQVRLLEQRVNKAVARISALQQENATLREELSGYQARVSELEQQIAQIKEDQTAIEQGILSALGQLDQLEDELTDDGEAAESGAELEDGETFAGERVSPETPATADTDPEQGQAAGSAPSESRDADVESLSPHSELDDRRTVSNASDTGETSSTPGRERDSATSGELEIF